MGVACVSWPLSKGSCFIHPNIVTDLNSYDSCLCRCLSKIRCSTPDLGTDCSEIGNAKKGGCFPHRLFSSSTVEMQHSDVVTTSSRKDHMSRDCGTENSICYMYCTVIMNTRYWVTQSANQHMHTFNFLFIKTYLKSLKTLLHVSVNRPSSRSL